MDKKEKPEPLQHSTECSHIIDMTNCLATAGQLTMMLANSVLQPPIFHPICKSIKSNFVTEVAFSTVLD